MDTSIELSTVLSIAVAITTVGGAWLTIRKISKDLKKEREVESAKILMEAKEVAAKIEANLVAKRAIAFTELEATIDTHKQELENFKTAVEKDFQHIRETYNGEIRNLGQKIEDLRSELRNQHSQLVGLLSKMIDPRD